MQRQQFQSFHLAECKDLACQLLLFLLMMILGSEMVMTCYTDTSALMFISRLCTPCSKLNTHCGGTRRDLGPAVRDRNRCAPFYAFAPSHRTHKQACVTDDEGRGIFEPGTFLSVGLFEDADADADDDGWPSTKWRIGGIRAQSMQVQARHSNQRPSSHVQQMNMPSRRASSAITNARELQLGGGLPRQCASAVRFCRLFFFSFHRSNPCCKLSCNG